MITNEFDATIFRTKDGKYSTKDTEDSEEVDVTIQYDYSPREARTWDYPGCPASVSIDGMIVDGKKVSRDKYSEEELEDYFWEKMIEREESQEDTGDDDYHRMIEEKIVYESKAIPAQSH